MAEENGLEELDSPGTDQLASCELSNRSQAITVKQSQSFWR